MSIASNWFDSLPQSLGFLPLTALSLDWFEYRKLASGKTITGAPLQGFLKLIKDSKEDMIPIDFIIDTCSIKMPDCSQTFSKNTPFYKALSSGDLIICDLLLQNNSHLLESRSEEGLTPVELAVKHESVTSVIYLMNKGLASINSKFYSSDESILHWAVLAGNETLFAVLLEAQVRTGFRDAKGNTLLHNIFKRFDSNPDSYYEMTSRLLSSQ